MNNSDIIEVRIYDNTHQIIFKGTAMLKVKTDTNRLKQELDMKGVEISIGKKEKGWFD